MEEQEIRFLEQVKMTETSMTSKSEEINQFLLNVHSDFENFLKKHKKEHNELNLKNVKLSELAHKTFDNIDQVRDSVEKYATILSCLFEYNSIDQALFS